MGNDEVSILDLHFFLKKGVNGATVEKVENILRNDNGKSVFVIWGNWPKLKHYVTQHNEWCRFLS